MDYLNIIIKTIIFFIIVLIAIRLLGKKEIGQISVFDLVVLLIIADIAVMGIDSNYHDVLLSITSVFVLLVLQKIFSFITLKFPRLRTIFDCKPSVLIYKGKLNLAELKKNFYTIDDLINQARLSGAMSLSEIEMAVLEPSGELSIFLKKEYKECFLPVIISGKFNNDNMRQLSLNEGDVISYLENKGLHYRELHYVSSNGKEFFIMPLL